MINIADNQSSPAPASPATSGETTCVAGIGSGTKSVPGKNGISIGDNAYGRLKKLLDERNTPEAGLRVAVKGGGCSGLSYALSWDNKAREKDRIFERDGVRVFVDPKSYIYLVGTVVEYEEKLLQSGFKLTNPQVRSTCGCGESFTV
ncbi:MAG TPA: iron-sulfur cluster assembly accessory protein [Myxococcales bacterium]|jgi:iron-sulfur cluster assembly protein|nr:iron-sulfur cluster assembly accessory protein [Myxococcales bacterium]